MDFEGRVQRVYELLLSPGDVAVDVGAHVGRHLIPMALRVAPTGRVLGFEPLPSCREQLASTIHREFPDLKPVVTLYGCALGESSGRAEFVVARDAMAYSGLKRRTYDVPTTLDRIPVEVRRLDEFALELDGVRYMKVDVEGGELHALRGASETIARFRPVVTFEFGASAIDEYGITTFEMGDFWLERGYRIFDVLGRPLSTRETFADSARDQRVWDYVALPGEDPSLAEKVVAELRSDREDDGAAAVE
ncbi:MAG TPA: FkbM family methyltransferase [Thermoanaerobaculia bacterium]